MGSGAAKSMPQARAGMPGAAGQQLASRSSIASSTRHTWQLAHPPSPLTRSHRGPTSTAGRHGRWRHCASHPPTRTPPACPAGVVVGGAEEEENVSGYGSAGRQQIIPPALHRHRRLSQHLPPLRICHRTSPSPPNTHPPAARGWGGSDGAPHGRPGLTRHTSCRQLHALGAGRVPAPAPGCAVCRTAPASPAPVALPRFPTLEAPRWEPCGLACRPCPAVSRRRKRQGGRRIRQQAAEAVSSRLPPAAIRRSARMRHRNTHTTHQSAPDHACWSQRPEARPPQSPPWSGRRPQRWR